MIPVSSGSLLSIQVLPSLNSAYKWIASKILFVVFFITTGGYFVYFVGPCKRKKKTIPRSYLCLSVDFHPTSLFLSSPPPFLPSLYFPHSFISLSTILLYLYPPPPPPPPLTLIAQSLLLRLSLLLSTGVSAYTQSSNLPRLSSVTS